MAIFTSGQAAFGLNYLPCPILNSSYLLDAGRFLFGFFFCVYTNAAAKNAKRHLIHSARLSLHVDSSQIVPLSVDMGDLWPH